MCRNKILSTAMAVALSAGATSAAMAGELDLKSPADGDSAWTVAAELFNPTGDASAIPDNDKFTVVYEFAQDVKDAFYFDFELTGGATWDGPGTTPTSNPIWWDGTNSRFLAGALECDVPLKDKWLSENGKAADSTARFVVQSDDTNYIKSGSKCSFYFQIDDATALASQGGEIKLKVSLPKTLAPAGTGIQQADSSDETTLVNSATGASFAFETDTEGSNTFPMVDVNNSGLTFTGGDLSTQPTKAILGTIKLNSLSTLKTKDLSTAWTFGSEPTPASGSITISNGNFAASKASPGQVFLDFSTSGNNQYTFDNSDTAIKDVTPSSITDSEATWNLTGEQIKYFGSSSNPNKSADIVIVADGTNAINTFTEEPTVTLFIKYSTTDSTLSGALRRIKSNGTVCTLYNIPNPSAIDTLSVKITNNSKKTANIYGTLVGKDGTELFRNKPLDPATIEPNQTVRIDAAGLKTAGELTDDWAGRAVLTIIGDVTNNQMSVSGLVRNSQGGPLMNMSVGATGNGCQ